MSSTPRSIATNGEPASVNIGELSALVRSQAETIAELEQRIAWFERQVFGPKSERLKVLDHSRQLLLGDVVPMGRKNWIFCWTELGARDVGIAQSLIVTCRLHQLNAYDYLVDVLQRVGQHPAGRVDELTPRRWKTLFADDPLRSTLHGVRT